MLAAYAQPLRDLVCFHCQQTAEKYLKAMLVELGLSFPKTHDLDTLLSILSPHDKTLKPLRRGLDALTSYAVEYRYPTSRTNARQMKSALRITQQIRAEIRSRLGLP